MGIAGKSLHILTPMYGGMCAFNYHTSIIKLVHQCFKYRVPLNFSNLYNESLITRARNKLADKYCKTSSETNALFIDADIGFEPEDIFAMLEEDYEIVGAPCPKKNIRWDCVQAAVKRATRELTPPELALASGDAVGHYKLAEGQTQKEVKVNEPQEMLRIGTGLLMIKRSVFQKVREAFPDRWYQPKLDYLGADPKTGVPIVGPSPSPVHEFFRVGINYETREYESEDFFYSNDCRQIGITIMMLPWVRTTHLGSHLFVGDLAAKIMLTGEV